MSSGRLLRIGIVGAAVTMLCCATPVLVVLFGAVGLAALVGWLDYVLLPALAGFLGLTGYALWRRRSERSSCNRSSPVPNADTARPR